MPIQEYATYNGYDFVNPKIGITMTPTYEGDDQKFPKYLEWEIDMEGIIQSTYGGGTEEVGWLGHFNAIKAALLISGKALRIKEGTNDICFIQLQDNDNFTINKYKAISGPFPTKCELIRIVAGMGSLIHWGCKATTNIPVADRDIDNLIHDSWILDYSMDQNFATTRSCSGSLLVKEGVNPDDYRDTVLSKLTLHPRFQRIRQDFKVRRANPRILDYHVMDKEVYLPFPSPMTEGDITVGLSVDGAMINISVSGDITAPNTVPRADLYGIMWTCLKLYVDVENRMVPFRQMRVSHSLFRNNLQFAFTAMFFRAKRDTIDQEGGIYRRLVDALEVIDKDITGENDKIYNAGSWGTYGILANLDAVIQGISVASDGIYKQSTGPRYQTAGARMSRVSQNVLDEKVEARIAVQPGTISLQPKVTNMAPIIQQTKPRSFIVKVSGVVQYAGSEIPSNLVENLEDYIDFEVWTQLQPFVVEQGVQDSKLTARGNQDSSFRIVGPELLGGVPVFTLFYNFLYCFIGKETKDPRAPKHGGKFEIPTLTISPYSLQGLIFSRGTISGL